MNLTKRIESARDNRRTAWSVARISQRELKVLESLVEKGLLFRNLTKRIESFTLITPFSVFTSPSNLTKRIERQMLWGRWTAIPKNLTKRIESIYWTRLCIYRAFYWISQRELKANKKKKDSGSLALESHKENWKSWCLNPEIWYCESGISQRELKAFLPISFSSFLSPESHKENWKY